MDPLLLAVLVVGGGYLYLRSRPQGLSDESRAQLAQLANLQSGIRNSSVGYADRSSVRSANAAGAQGTGNATTATRNAVVVPSRVSPTAAASQVGVYAGVGSGIIVPSTPSPLITLDSGPTIEPAPSMYTGGNTPPPTSTDLSGGGGGTGFDDRPPSYNF